MNGIHYPYTTPRRARSRAHVLYMQTFLLSRYRVFGRNDVESQTFKTSHAHVHALRNRLGCNGAPQFPVQSHHPLKNFAIARLYEWNSDFSRNPDELFASHGRVPATGFQPEPHPPKRE